MNPGPRPFLLENQTKVASRVTRWTRTLYKFSFPGRPRCDSLPEASASRSDGQAQARLARNRITSRAARHRHSGMRSTLLILLIGALGASAAAIRRRCAAMALPSMSLASAGSNHSFVHLARFLRLVQGCLTTLLAQHGRSQARYISGSLQDLLHLCTNQESGQQTHALRSNMSQC